MGKLFETDVEIHANILGREKKRGMKSERREMGEGSPIEGVKDVMSSAKRISAKDRHLNFLPAPRLHSTYRNNTQNQVDMVH